MYNEIFLMGCIEMPVIVRERCTNTIQVFCQTSPVILRPVNLDNYMRNDRVLLLGFDPVTVCKITELLVLLHYLSSSDYDLLVYPLTFLYHVDVVGFSPGRISDMGTVQQFPYGFLI